MNELEESIGKKSTKPRVFSRKGWQIVKPLTRLKNRDDSNYISDEGVNINSNLT